MKSNASTAIDKAVEFFMYLQRRWQDEREHEDFAEYVSAMTKWLPEGSTDVVMMRSPFQVIFTDAQGTRHYIKSTAVGAEWGTLVPITPVGRAPPRRVH